MQRGPLIYCAEGVDNENDILSVSLKKDGEVTVGEYLPDELFGIQKLFAQGYRETVNEELYSFERQEAQPCQVTLVPYYTWGNQGLNQMRVWIRKNKAPYEKNAVNKVKKGNCLRERFPLYLL